MKKLLLSLLFLLFATQMFASLRQTKYRWRNDDGNETTATWKAAENTPITVNDTSRFRLRLELDNDNADGDISIVENTLEYSSDNGSTWTVMDNSAGQAFAYTTSLNVSNNQATTNQMGSTTFGTFVAGHIIAGSAGPSSMNLGDAARTEMEWVIKPTLDALPNTTYIFQISGQEDLALVNPQINTGCIGAMILSKHDSSSCGPGTVPLNATCTGNATVQWYDAPAGGNLLTTGNSFTTPSLSTTTTYYVSAKRNITPFCESPRTAVTATIYPVPSVNLGPNVTVCSNVPVTLNAGGSYAYLWDNGSTNITRTVNAPGTYFVTVTGIGNCKKSDTVIVNHNPLPIVNLGNDTIVCPGVIITLDAGNAGSTYLWNDGFTAQTRDVGETGNYAVVVTNEFNCTATDNVSITIKSFPLGEINAVKGSPATYTFNVLGALFATEYQWDFGDGSPVALGFFQQHTYAHNGIYTVHLTMVGDCDSTSNSYRQRTVDVYDAASTTGIGNTALKDVFSFYPNPANETVNVTFDNALKIEDIEVFNILGQKIRLPYTVSASGITLRVTQLSNGIYSMKINTDKGSVIQKFEIRR
ncbi:T9SS type A sorting domain-containing protein [Taibaiella lutea]|uniref:T9SS type A sorting domain-containing protein n=1 Tax=Taibaiella lutea TaxID=2608001 RepID=A0A5M6CTL3_9BACT|nr:T9SS type A sorting domain-containing protein [Taibaiella lutea]KAA5537302.1 T9SS type A sorting domain-containing protein [Taibaiella lutea]